MRVIELTDLYEPAIGGLERFVRMLSEQLVLRGHEVHVVTSTVPGTPAIETIAGVTVHRLPLLYQKLTPRLSLDAAGLSIRRRRTRSSSGCSPRSSTRSSRTSSTRTRGVYSPAWPGPSPVRPSW